MSESKAYSSLFALVDSHLSKTSINESTSDGTHTGIQIPSFNDLRGGIYSETRLSVQPIPRLPIPTLNSGGSSITSVLAEQVANMLKAKEKKQEEVDRLKLAEELRRLEIEDEKNSVIDLMKALQTPYKLELVSQAEKVMSSSSSLESLTFTECYDLTFTECCDEPEKTKTPEPLLPCSTDMSYILKQKIKNGKCSTFGNVFSSKLKPFAFVYLKENVNTSIARFKFNTMSPCDVIKGKLRRPKVSCS